MFESFLANKYTAAKRFGLEGCEALIPGMKALIDHGAGVGGAWAAGGGGKGGWGGWLAGWLAGWR